MSDTLHEFYDNIIYKASGTLKFITQVFRACLARFKLVPEEEEERKRGKKQIEGEREEEKRQEEEKGGSRQ